MRPRPGHRVAGPLERRRDAQHAPAGAGVLPWLRLGRVLLRVRGLRPEGQYDKQCERVNDAFGNARPGNRQLMDPDDDYFERQAVWSHELARPAAEAAHRR